MGWFISIGTDLQSKQCGILHRFFLYLYCIAKSSCVECSMIKTNKMKHLFFVILIFVGCNYSNKAVTFYPNGALKSEVVIEKGKKNGMAKVYFENGIIEQTGMWVDNKQEGIWNFYYPDGKIKAEIEFKNDMQNGKSVFYFSNGRVNEINYFINNKLEGAIEVYYDNGALKEKSEWRNGKKEGYTIKYDSLKNIVEKTFYSNGKFISKNPDSAGMRG